MVSARTIDFDGRRPVFHLGDSDCRKPSAWIAVFAGMKNRTPDLTEMQPPEAKHMLERELGPDAAVYAATRARAAASRGAEGDAAQWDEIAERLNGAEENAGDQSADR